MTTPSQSEAVAKAAEVFAKAVSAQRVLPLVEATDFVYDAAEAVLKLLDPFVVRAEVVEDEGYDVDLD